MPVITNRHLLNNKQINVQDLQLHDLNWGKPNAYTCGI